MTSTKYKSSYKDLVALAAGLLRAENNLSRVQSRRGTDIDVVNVYKMVKGMSRCWFELLFADSGFNRADIFRDARAKLMA